MITIKEVALLAGVSKSTVSRVLNKNDNVSKAAREKVEKVIFEQNYSPSAFAVNLSKRKSSAIGATIPELDNSFFGEIMKGISEVAEEREFSVFCFDTSNSAHREDRALQMLKHQRVSGLIITPTSERTEEEDARRFRDSLNNLGVPIVVVDRHIDGIALDGVYYENEKSGYVATSELIKAGNRKLAIITGDVQLRIARDRFQGFKQAVADAGLELDEKFILKGDFSIDTAYRLTKEMLESGDIPDGIVTSNNRTSMGFLKAVREKGLKIGKDIAVIGIDSIDILDILDYKFSCVARDSCEMGRVAMRLILDRIENGTSQQIVHHVPCELILKGSERKGN
ncbi:MAG: LacI family transcriptional regulator [Oscillospiraceae bacterium]|nr:LacI family transcriptional regulator [Oscillospiraceae bacterium]